jgi:ubiquinone/menaquinone biosynthesis C-methylase UbiE
MQNRSLDKIKFHDGDKILCVGVGTGNEIVNVVKRNHNVNIVGVDYSTTALRKAAEKAETLGFSVETLTMDVRELKFLKESFDKVICLHVTDFINDVYKATAEIVRVLKLGGEFVITYPSHKDGAKLGLNLLKDRFLQSKGSGNQLKGILRFLAQTLIGTAYMPLLLRSKRRTYTRQELHYMFSRLLVEWVQIEPFSLYQDFVVYGRK